MGVDECGLEFFLDVWAGVFRMMESFILRDVVVLCEFFYVWTPPYFILDTFGRLPVVWSFVWRYLPIYRWIVTFYPPLMRMRALVLGIQYPLSNILPHWLLSFLLNTTITLLCSEKNIVFSSGFVDAFLFYTGYFW